jgi:hypothetical protein
VRSAPSRRPTLPTHACERASEPESEQVDRSDTIAISTWLPMSSRAQVLKRLHPVDAAVIGDRCNYVAPIRGGLVPYGGRVRRVRMDDAEPCRICRIVSCDAP